MDAPIPPGVNYDMWVGPAPYDGTFNPNRYNRNWNWFRSFGNGDIGGDGPHDIDLARWGLGVDTHPVRITAHGSRIALSGQREFPDNMMVAYHYDEGKVLLYEDAAGPRTVCTASTAAMHSTVAEGYMIFSRRGYFQVYLGKNEEEWSGHGQVVRGVTPSTCTISSTACAAASSRSPTPRSRTCRPRKRLLSPLGASLQSFRGHSTT